MGRSERLTGGRTGQRAEVWAGLEAPLAGAAPRPATRAGYRAPARASRSKRHCGSVPRVKAWTHDERLELRRLYPSLPDAELAARFATTEAEVAAEARRMALGKSKAVFKGQPMPRWTEAELARLQELYPSHSNREIGRILGRSAASVLRKAARMGLRKTELRRAIAGAQNVRARRSAPPKPDEVHDAEE